MAIGTPADSFGRLKRPWRIRRTLIAIVAVLAILSLPFISRRFVLRDLPDVGDPFDVAKYGHIKLADDDNAIEEYSIASTMLTGAGGNQAYDELTAVTKDDWSKAGTVLKTWLSTNKAALDIWRKGTEKPDSLYYQPNVYTFSTILPVIQKLREVVRLATAQGAKLESEGKMDEAYGWYRAILRSSRHLGRHGVLIERLVGIALHAVAAERISHWAKDPRVNAKMLRQALEDVQKIDQMTAPDSEVIRSLYFLMMNTFQDPKEMKLLLQYASRPANNGSGYGVWRIIDDIRLWGLDRFQESKVYSRNEPERSKRVLRLIFANILAHCDDPPSRSPPKAESSLPLYQTKADDPPAVRALSPNEIQKWYDTTNLRQRILAGVECFQQRGHARARRSEARCS